MIFGNLSSVFGHHCSETMIRKQKAGRHTKAPNPKKNPSTVYTNAL